MSKTSLYLTIFKTKAILSHQYYSDISFIFSNAQLVNSTGANSYDKTLFDVIGLNNQIKKMFQEDYGYEVLSVGNKVTGATGAMRASFIPYCIPFPQTSISVVHDEAIAIYATLYNKIAYIEECLIKYRLHYKQTIGLNGIFKYPPQSWELSENVSMHHQELIEPHDQDKKNKLTFIFKRFYAIRELSGLIELFTFFLKGEYKRNYSSDAVSVFIKDIESFFKRQKSRIFIARN